ncbi:iron ABC transporter permease [Paracoccus caeni]|uniref:Iron ABC transporter permease n=1 Tax=Paracoccus caeni TaxID=657651 RepID=A0A934SEM5_9RHOB|nr:iron ABC transporter permease [Paracoccus caeni]MBK4215964.1 iron ABC transporter permease [Paracoccus caeni]
MTRLPALLALTLGVGLLALWALTVGSADLPVSRVIEALWQGGEAREDLLVLTVRLPRVLAAIAVGAALAAAGTMLQAVTRNPLADPGILGVNAGAAFAVVLLLALDLAGGRGSYVWAAFIGAGAAVVLVHTLGMAGQRGGTPLRITLAGVIVGSFLMSVTSALLIFDAGTLDAVRIWTVGSLAGIRMQDVVAVMPWIGLALVAAMLSRGAVEVLAMGEDIASGLGLNLTLWWRLTVVMVALLAGGAVALAGPVGFVGLIVPHAIRLVWGAGYGARLPFAMVTGAAVLLIADTLPRAVWDRDVPVGVALAVLGAPVFIWLAQGKRAGRLA